MTAEQREQLKASILATANYAAMKGYHMLAGGIEVILYELASAEATEDEHGSRQEAG